MSHWYCTQLIAVFQMTEEEKSSDTDIDEL